MKAESPYLTAKEASEYLRCPSMRAFYQRRYRLRIPASRLGGSLFFKQSDLDAAFEKERPARPLRKVIG